MSSPPQGGANSRPGELSPSYLPTVGWATLNLVDLSAPAVPLLPPKVRPISAEQGLLAHHAPACAGSPAASSLHAPLHLCHFLAMMQAAAAMRRGLLSLGKALGLIWGGEASMGLRESRLTRALQVGLHACIIHLMCDPLHGTYHSSVCHDLMVTTCITV